MFNCYVDITLLTLLFSCRIRFHGGSRYRVSTKFAKKSLDTPPIPRIAFHPPILGREVRKKFLRAIEVDHPPKSCASLVARYSRRLVILGSDNSGHRSPRSSYKKGLSVSLAGIALHTSEKGVPRGGRRFLHPQWRRTAAPAAATRSQNLYRRSMTPTLARRSWGDAGGGGGDVERGMTGVGGTGVRTLCAHDVQYQVGGFHPGWGGGDDGGGSCKRGMVVAEEDGEGVAGRQGERGRRLASGRQPFCGTATSGSLLFPPPLASSRTSLSIPLLASLVTLHASFSSSFPISPYLLRFFSACLRSQLLPESSVESPMTRLSFTSSLCYLIPRLRRLSISRFQETVLLNSTL